MEVPDRVYNYCATSLASSPLLRPPRSRPRSRSHSRPISATALVSVPAPVPVSILCPSMGLHPCPRSRSHGVPAPVPISGSFVRLISVPVPAPSPSPFTSPLPSLFPPPFAPRYDTRVKTPGLANGAVGCSQAPPSVCRDGDACGMKVPAVKQNRIAAEDVLLPSLLPDVGTRWSVAPTCALAV